MGVNSLPKTVTRQRRGCDLNPGPSAPESSTLTTRLPITQHVATPLKLCVLRSTAQGAHGILRVGAKCDRSKRLGRPLSRVR